MTNMMCLSEEMTVKMECEEEVVEPDQLHIKPEIEVAQGIIQPDAGGADAKDGSVCINEGDVRETVVLECRNDGMPLNQSFNCSMSVADILIFLESQVGDLKLMSQYTKGRSTRTQKYVQRNGEYQLGVIFSNEPNSSVTHLRVQWFKGKEEIDDVAVAKYSSPPPAKINRVTTEVKYLLEGSKGHEKKELQKFLNSSLPRMRLRRKLRGEELVDSIPKEELVPRVQEGMISVLKPGLAKCSQANIIPDPGNMTENSSAVELTEDIPETETENNAIMEVLIDHIGSSENVVMESEEAFMGTTVDRNENDAVGNTMKEAVEKAVREALSVSVEEASVAAVDTAVRDVYETTVSKAVDEAIGKALVCLEPVNTTVEGKRHKCPQCSYSTNKKSDLRKHVDSVHLNKKTICNMCGVGVKNIREHIRFLHDTRKDYKCGKCNYSCVKQSDLKRHLNKHLGY